MNISNELLTIGATSVPLGSLILWILKRQGQLIVATTRIETKIDVLNEIKIDVKDHEKRLTLIEPKLERTHDRLDSISEKIKLHG